MPRSLPVPQIQMLKKLQARRLKEMRKKGLSAVKIRKYQKGMEHSIAWIKLANRAISEANLIRTKREKKSP